MTRKKLMQTLIETTTVNKSTTERCYFITTSKIKDFKLDFAAEERFTPNRSYRNHE